MIRRLAILLCRLRRDSGGASAVEFALIFPIFALVLFGIIEVALLCFTLASVETAAIEAARYGQTGRIPSSGTRTDQMLALVAQRTLGFIAVDQATVTARVYPSFAAIDAAEPFSDANGNGLFDPGESYSDVNGDGAWGGDQGIVGMGGPGDVVLYRITFVWTGFTPLWHATVGDAPFSVSVAVQNEPYPEEDA